MKVLAWWIMTRGERLGRHESLRWSTFLDRAATGFHVVVPLSLGGNADVIALITTSKVSFTSPPITGVGRVVGGLRIDDLQPFGEQMGIESYQPAEAVL